MSKLPTTGDTVKYARHFLKSCATSPTDPIWFVTGVITNIIPPVIKGDWTIATVTWNKDWPGSSRIALSNLIAIHDQHTEER